MLLVRGYNRDHTRVLAGSRVVSIDPLQVLLYVLFSFFHYSRHTTNPPITAGTRINGTQ